MQSQSSRKVFTARLPRREPGTFPDLRPPPARTSEDPRYSLAFIRTADGGTSFHVFRVSSLIEHRVASPRRVVNGRRRRGSRETRRIADRSAAHGRENIIGKIRRRGGRREKRDREFALERVLASTRTRSRFFEITASTDTSIIAKRLASTTGEHTRARARASRRATLSRISLASD